MCFSDITMRKTECQIDRAKFIKDMFESSPHYRKRLSIMFLMENIINLLTECG